MFVFFSLVSDFLSFAKNKKSKQTLCLCLLISAFQFVKDRCVRYCYLLCKSKRADYYISILFLVKCDVALNGFCSILPFWFVQYWWRQTGSNRWPPACKAGALPTELCPRYWWVWEDLNLRPHAYQACALTSWATNPDSLLKRILPSLKLLPHLFQFTDKCECLKPLLSLERRWSSRRFPYGYLVTTSPQSWSIPW